MEGEKCHLGPKEKYVNVCACINETNKYQSVPIKREEVAVLYVYMYAFSPPITVYTIQSPWQRKVLLLSVSWRSIDYIDVICIRAIGQQLAFPGIMAKKSSLFFGHLHTKLKRIHRNDFR
jgi:hypothetical protein